MDLTPGCPPPFLRVDLSCMYTPPFKNLASVPAPSLHAVFVLYVPETYVWAHHPKVSRLCEVRELLQQADLVVVGDQYLGAVWDDGERDSGLSVLWNLGLVDGLAEGGNLVVHVHNINGQAGTRRGRPLWSSCDFPGLEKSKEKTSSVKRRHVLISKGPGLHCTVDVLLKFV